MKIAVVSDKGGVGKTMTAVHLAGYLGEVYGPDEVCVLDGDPNESVFDYSDRGGEDFGIQVFKPGVYDVPHQVIDSEGRLSPEDLQTLAEQVDLFVVPSFVDLMSLKVTQNFLSDLEDIGGAPYRVLFTMVPWWEARVKSLGIEQFDKSGRPRFERVIESRRAYVLASDVGVLAKDLPGWRARAAWEDYGAVGDEMLTVVGEEVELA